MTITKIQWHEFYDSEKSRARGMCTVVIDDALAINEVRVVYGRERMFVAYPPSPSRESASRFDSGVCYPIRKDIQRQWEEQILESYYLERAKWEERKM